MTGVEDCPKQHFWEVSRWQFGRGVLCVPANPSFLLLESPTFRFFTILIQSLIVHQ